MGVIVFWVCSTTPISSAGTIQIKALKEINSQIEKLNKEKSDKIMYKLPAIQLCSWSLI